MRDESAQESKAKSGSIPNFFIIPAAFLIFNMVMAFLNNDTDGGRVYFVGAMISLALASDRFAQNRRDSD